MKTNHCTLTGAATAQESCCTCAKLLASVPQYSAATEKPLPSDRRLECCARVICGNCIHVRPVTILLPPASNWKKGTKLTVTQNNPRFASYCPYCQTSSTPSLLPTNLKDPPSYTPATHLSSAPPPPYTPGASAAIPPNDEKTATTTTPTPTPPEDTLHFLNHDHDTIPSLSLRYGVPADILRRANNLTSDHLLHARRTVLIPGEYYPAGVSLSPRPVEGEEEELRKSRIRRFMTGCKVSDYDVAVLYLEQAEYDLAVAMEAYFADEAWEREHPVQEGGKKPRNRGPFWRGSA
ncbi:hypothetical protein CCHL11_03487 [Colletotrichum chlorophyti]|uniref:LysM domain-containing protein n=1 Tax=Colletotrichum chlorophyti TaxID=708187 RepID=A0A1Q8S061_9PEZI|nr:hypothetical protein CCHL11_03487 [Colletotrichum chlorophyti]